jgi:predicted small secreted protein
MRRKLSDRKELTEKFSALGKTDNEFPQNGLDCGVTEVKEKTIATSQDAEHLFSSCSQQFVVRKMTRFLSFVLLLGFMSIGCHTFEGAKRDARDAGDAIGDGAEELGEDIDDALD